MRIISGKNKGKRLIAPAKLPVRPTTDLAKESLFNILNNEFYLEDLSVLDLFSGTGNISYEFASRGCGDVTAVDIHAGCVAFIRKTSQDLGYDIKTIKANVFDFLQRNSQKFDVIFADPPYEFSLEQFLRIINEVFDNNLLNGDGLLVVEHSAKTELSDHKNFAYSKKYGGNMFSFFQNLEEDE